MSRLLRGYGIYHLRPPTSVGPGIAFHGPGVRLTDPFSQRDLVRRKTKSRLSPPAVLASLAPFVATPVSVHFAPSPRGARKTKYQLVPPFVVEAAVGPLGGLATQFTQPPRPRAKARLSAPVIVNASQAESFYGPNVTLAPFRTGKPKSLLLPVPDAFQPFRSPILLLAYQPTRVKAKSRLSAPVVVAPVLARPIDITFAPQGRGVVLSVLRPPVVIGPVLARAIGVRLARILPSRVNSVLRRPADLVDSADIGYVRVHLSYSLRGTPKSRLLPPSVVTPVSTFVASPVTVSLAPSARQGRRATYDLAGPFVINAPPRAKGRTATQFVQPPRIPTHSRLFPPAVITEAVTATYSGPFATLAPSRAGKAKPRLLSVPDAFQPFRAATVSLSYAPTRAQAKSRLYPPTVVAQVLAPPIDITFAKIRPVPVRPFLRPVLYATQANAETILSVSLAPSRRPKSKSFFLRAPVVGAGIAFHGPGVRLTNPLSSNGLNPGKAKSRLSPPVVVDSFFAAPIQTALVRIRPVRTQAILGRPTDLIDQQDLGFVRVHLVRIRTVAARARLAAPVVIDLTPQTQFISVTLAYSLRGTPKSTLSAPPKTTPQPAPIYPLFVTLAPHSRGKAKSFLRTTIYAAKSYAPITVTLAPSRFPRPKSILRKPVVVAPVLARAIQVELAPQRRGVAKPFLREIVYGAKSYEPIRVTLVASPRLARASHFRLPAPKVVREPVAQPIGVSLARIVPPKRFYLLSPPAVVGAGITFRGLDVTLAYSRRGKPMYRLTLTREQIIECFGIVVGTDFAATVCGTTSAATVQGVTSAATVEGTTSAATVEGTTSSRGTVSGGDTQREGCE